MGKEWFWLRDEIAAYVENDPPGTRYTEAELRSAITTTHWGGRFNRQPVTQADCDAAYDSMFKQTCEERGPVLQIIDGHIRRTHQRPAYSD